MYGLTISVRYMKKLSLLSFLENLGSNVERVCVVFVNVPTEWVKPSTSVFEYLNSLSLKILSTVNVPLYPLSSSAVPFVELVTFKTTIWSPTFKLWRLSDRIVTKFNVLSKLACEINLVLRSKS